MEITPCLKLSESDSCKLLVKKQHVYVNVKKWLCITKFINSFHSQFQLYIKLNKAMFFISEMWSAYHA